MRARHINFKQMSDDECDYDFELDEDDDAPASPSEWFRGDGYNFSLSTPTFNFKGRCFEQPEFVSSFTGQPRISFLDKKFIFDTHVVSYPGTRNPDVVPTEVFCATPEVEISCIVPPLAQVKLCGGKEVELFDNKGIPKNEDMKDVDAISVDEPSDSIGSFGLVFKPEVRDPIDIEDCGEPLSRILTFNSEVRYDETYHADFNPDRMVEVSLKLPRSAIYGGIPLSASRRVSVDLFPCSNTADVFEIIPGEDSSFSGFRKTRSDHCNLLDGLQEPHLPQDNVDIKFMSFASVYDAPRASFAELNNPLFLIVLKLPRFVLFGGNRTSCSRRVSLVLNPSKHTFELFEVRDPGISESFNDPPLTRKQLRARKKASKKNSQVPAWSNMSVIGRKRFRANVLQVLKDNPPRVQTNFNPVNRSIKLQWPPN